MNSYKLNKGIGRTKVSLSAYYMGNDIVVSIYNENSHIGAVALGEYDHQAQRVSTSVITRLGHKDDVLAQKAACLISRKFKRPVCVIAGVHIDNITKDETDQILANTDSLVDNFVADINKLNG